MRTHTLTSHKDRVGLARQCCRTQASRRRQVQRPTQAPQRGLPVPHCASPGTAAAHMVLSALMTYPACASAATVAAMNTRCCVAGSTRPRSAKRSVYSSCGSSWVLGLQGASERAAGGRRTQHRCTGSIGDQRQRAGVLAGCTRAFTQPACCSRGAPCSRRNQRAGSRSQPAGGGGNGGGAPARKPEAALCAKPPAEEVASCVYRTAHRRSRPSVCGAALANRPALRLASPAPRVPRNGGRWPKEHRRQLPVGIWGRSGGRPPSAAGRGRRRAAGDGRNRAPLLACASSQLVALGKMGLMLPPLLPLEPPPPRGRPVM